MSEYIFLDSQEKETNENTAKEAESYEPYDGDDEAAAWNTVKSKRKREGLNVENIFFLSFQDKDKLKQHTIKHKKPKVPHKAVQTCSICTHLKPNDIVQFKSDNHLKDHIQRKRSPMEYKE